MIKEKYLNLIIICFAIILILAFSWQEKIIFTDEILFEEASYQMLTTGDLLTPHLEDKVWLSGFLIVPVKARR